MSTSRYNQLFNEIKTFHILNDTKDRPEKDVYLLCSEMLAKTLPSMSSLNRIRLTFREKDRIIELAYWIFNHLCEEYEKVGRRYLFKIKKEKDIQKCVQTLHHFFNFTSQHAKIFDIIDENPKKISLTEYIYRFYRYTKRMDLIDSKGFHISSFIEDVNFIPDFKDLMTLITSDCQNGKTFLVMAVSLIYISLGFTPVFIVLSKSQVLQLTFRLKTYIRELKTYIVSLNMFSEEQLDFLSENFLYFDAENKLMDDDDRLRLAINSEKPRFVICIKHYQHLERVNKQITDDSKICLIADEAQVSCCYKDISNIPTYHDDSVKYDKEFITLRQKSTKFIAVSATVQDIIMVEENLYSDNIVFIPQSKNYVGISLWNSNILDISEDKKDDIIPNSALKIITELSKTEPISRNNYRFDKEDDKHPIIVLLKTERKKERHLSMLENFIKKRYNNDINNGNWCFIVEHGDGFYIYHHSFPNEPMKIENQLSTIKDRKIHYFSSSGKNVVNITDIFQFIAEIGIDTIPRVLLISYDMCKESTSFVSHYDKPDNYHLTHGIFLLNNKISVASLIQTMSRLCGNHGDDIRPTLYTTEKARSNIMNGYLTHKEQIQALMKMSEAGNVNVSIESCKDFLEKHPLFKNRVPTTYNKVKGVKKTLISNPNEEKEKEMLKNKKLGIIDYFCEAEPEEYKDEKEMCDLYYYSESESDDESEEEEGDEESEEDEDNIDGVDLIKLRDWIREDCNLLISKMIKFLYKQNKPVSLDEFRRGINYNGKDIISNISNGRGNNTKYGKLWSVSNNILILNPKIKNYLDKL
jgi:hypothetical protein